jgi:hypothetical protein
MACMNMHGANARHSACPVDELSPRLPAMLGRSTTRRLGDFHVCQARYVKLSWGSRVPSSPDAHPEPSRAGLWSGRGLAR